jgi:hypothetical protein
LAALIAAGLSVLATAAAGGARPKHQPGAYKHCAASSSVPTAGRHPAYGPLVPAKPIALRLCRYGPLPSYTLEASRLLTARRQVRRLVRGLNSLPAMPAGAFACPVDNGSSIAVIAIYRRSAARTVHVELTGCLIATRGGVVRWDLPSHGRFVHRLEGLAR